MNLSLVAEVGCSESQAGASFALGCVGCFLSTPASGGFCSRSVAFVRVVLGKKAKQLHKAAVLLVLQQGGSDHDKGSQTLFLGFSCSF